MRSLKQLGFIIALSAIVCFGMESSKGVELPLDKSVMQVSPEIRLKVANEKEVVYNRQANYLNYIQYSTSKIIKSNSKVAIDAERFDVLNHIKKEGLGNEDLIEAYANLLNTMKNYEMGNNKRELLKLDIENRRRNAFWQAASNLGNSVIAAGTISAGSGGTGAIAALAGVFVNTGVNYVRTQNEISDDSLKKSLELFSGELSSLRDQQINLFEATAKVFKNRESDEDLSLIRENAMNQFTDLLVEYDKKNFEEQNQDVFIAKLSDYDKQNWILFQPYHEFFVKLYGDKYVKSWNLCIAEGGNDKECSNKVDNAALDSAIVHYNDLRYISTKSKFNIFVKENGIMKNASKRLLQPLLIQGKKYAGVIDVVISDLERSVDKEDAIELADSRFLIYTAYLSLGKKEKAKAVFSKLERTAAVKKSDRMYHVHHCNEMNEKNDFCEKATEMWNVLDSVGNENYREYEYYECINIESEKFKKSSEGKTSPSQKIDPDNLGAKKYWNYVKSAAGFVADGIASAADGIASFSKDAYDYVADTPEKECVAEIDKIKEEMLEPEKLFFGNEKQIFLNRFYVINKKNYFFKGHQKRDGEHLKANVFVNQNNVVFDSLEIKFK